MTSSQNGFANPADLVDTAWVAEPGADPSVHLIEVDVDTTAYAAGHLLGAAG